MANAEMGITPHFRVSLFLVSIIAGSVACGPTSAPLSAAHRSALADTLLTIFDSVSAIHTAHPDTGLLRRLHPPADSLVFKEGGVPEVVTGDSLFRRVLALHVPVRAMTQRFTERRGFVQDVNTGLISAIEDVDWVDTKGPHQYHGALTMVVVRQAGRWVVRAYIS